MGMGIEPEGDLLPTAPPEGGVLNLRKDEITGIRVCLYCQLGEKERLLQFILQAAEAPNND